MLLSVIILFRTLMLSEVSISFLKPVCSGEMMFLLSNIFDNLWLIIVVYSLYGIDNNAMGLKLFKSYSLPEFLNIGNILACSHSSGILEFVNASFKMFTRLFIAFSDKV